MKKVFLILILTTVSQFANAQAFAGKGDKKFQVGMNMQKNATGIASSLDFGAAQNMSFGFYATYLLNTNMPEGVNIRFEDKFDAKFRFNAHIGDVLKLNPKMDIYPGLNLGTRNFGGHLGFRYFFTEGFGVYAEASAPFAKFDSNVVGREHFNNQFIFQIGASFNL